MTANRPFLPKHLGTYIFLIFLSLFVVLPLMSALSQSFMTNEDVNRWPPQIIPVNPTLASYQTLFTQPDLKLLTWLGNSLYAAAAYTAIVMVLCAPAAYA